MEIRFDGKKALVTGAGKGIGAGIVRALVKGGADLYALSRTQSDLDALVTEMPKIHPICLDLSEHEAVKKAIIDTGPFDLVINNAGIAAFNSVLDVPLNEFQRIMDVNLTSVLNVSQTAAKGMIENKIAGSIVNVSSAASQNALKEHVSYSTSKAGLNMLTKMMALELGPHKIRTNAVLPTVVLTKLGLKAWGDEDRAGPMRKKIPMGRFVEVDEVVAAVLYLLSDQASMTNGVLLPIDGGLLIN